VTYRLTPAAEVDLDSIATYIGERNSPAAVRLLEKFTRRWELLATQPHSGRARDDIGPDLRSVIIGNFIALYRVESDDVIIVRVLHGSRDLDTKKYE
jgi:toxin ParE1/3/4